MIGLADNIPGAHEAQRVKRSVFQAYDLRNTKGGGQRLRRIVDASEDGAELKHDEGQT